MLESQPRVASRPGCCNGTEVIGACTVPYTIITIIILSVYIYAVMQDFYHQQYPGSIGCIRRSAGSQARSSTTTSRLADWEAPNDQRSFHMGPEMVWEASTWTNGPRNGLGLLTLRSDEGFESGIRAFAAKHLRNLVRVLIVRKFHG